MHWRYCSLALSHRYEFAGYTCIVIWFSFCVIQFCLREGCNWDQLCHPRWCEQCLANQRRLYICKVISYRLTSYRLSLAEIIWFLTDVENGPWALIQYVEIRWSWDCLTSTMGFLVLVKCHLYIELDLRSWLQREWVHLDPMWKNQVLFIGWTCWTKWPPILQTARNLPFHLKLILFLFPQYVVSIKPKCNFFSKKILLTMSSAKMLVILFGLQYLFCWKGAARLLIACCALIKRFDVIEWTCVYIYMK